MPSGQSRVAVTVNRRRALHPAPTWDVFISHSSMDKGTATRLAYDLKELGKRVWIDYEYLVAGDLLPIEVGEAIRDSRAVILMWSEATDESPWVAQELQTALSIGQHILLCLLDQTPYRHHPELVDRFWCDFGSSYDAGLAQLMRGLAILDAEGAPRLQPTRAKRAPAPERGTLASLQDAVLAALTLRDFHEATALQARLDPLLDRALQRWPRDPEILSLAGYQHQRAFQMSTRNDSKVLPRHRRVLDQAEVFFHRALASEPGSVSALNGLGAISAYRANWEMAEHYCLRAIQQARQLGLDYGSTKEDLAAIRAHKARLRVPARGQADRRRAIDATGPRRSRGGTGRPQSAPRDTPRR